MSLSLKSLSLALAVALAPAVGVSTVALAAQPEPNQPVLVVATISILADMVRQVGGSNVDVKSLVGPGGDAHVYQPTPADAQTIAQAQVVVENGLGLEGWIDRLIQASGTKAQIVIASASVKPQTMEDEDQKGPDGKPKVITDPHAWQNLANGSLYAQAIGDALAKADPLHADSYHSRAKAYAQKIMELDAQVREQIKSVPQAKRKIITTHDAFGYFGRAYGVTFLAPEGISTDSEPTAAAMGKLADQIKREHIKALFLENMTDPRLLQTLAKEAHATIGATVYSDSLSPQDGPAPTYLDMFRHNVPAFVAAMKSN